MAEGTKTAGLTAPAGAWPGSGESTLRTPVRTPEISELRAFCAAADLGSIGRAARLLHVSQPALSKRLRTLETIAGADLLYRSSRGVRLTAAGSKLYLAARRLLDSADQVQALISGLTSTAPTVRVATDPNSGEVWLPPSLLALHSTGEHRVSVEVVTANSAIVRAMVREGRADLGLAAIEPGTGRDQVVTERAVWEDEVVLAVPLEHPWSTRPEIDVETFAATALIRRDPGASSSRAVDAMLSQLGMRQVAPLAEIGSTTAALAIARSTQTPALVSATALAAAGETQLVGRRVRGVRFELRFGLVFAGLLTDLTPPARALATELMAFRGGGRRAPQAAASAASAAAASAGSSRGGIRREITLEIPSPPIDTP